MKKVVLSILAAASVMGAVNSASAGLFYEGYEFPSKNAHCIAAMTLVAGYNYDLAKLHCAFNDHLYDGTW